MPSAPTPSAIFNDGFATISYDSLPALSVLNLSSLFQASSKLSQLLIFVNRLMKSYDGKDKSLKLLQYFLKMVLDFHLALPQTRSRLSKASSQLSLARRLFRLFRWSAMLSILRHQYPSDDSDRMTRWQLVYSIFEATSSGLDDFSALSSLFQLNNAALVRSAERYSVLAWWANVHMDLYTLLNSPSSIEFADSCLAAKDKASLVDKFREDQIFRIRALQLIKLLSDYLFCAIDYTDAPFPRLKTLAGMTSSLSAFVKHCSN